MRTALIYILPVIVLAGCATAPQTHDFENQRELPISKDAAWSNLMEWFTSRQIQIKTVEKDSGIIYAERAYAGNVPTSTYADCGKLGETPIQPSSVGLNVFVREVGRNTTRVTVNTTYSASYIDQWNGTLVQQPCTSRGALEDEVLAAVGGK